MTTTSPLVERPVVGIDIKGFGRLNLRRQMLLQRDLHLALDEATERAGLDRPRWDRQWTGDGENAVLPPDADLTRLVGTFPDELESVLAVRNVDCTPETRLRVRVSVGSDVLLRHPIEPDSLGFAGPALVEVVWLLNAAPARDALDRAEHANVALIVAESLHRKVALAGLPGIWPDEFQEVDLELPEKGFRTKAYIRVPGDRRGPGPEAPDPTPRGPEAPGPTSRGPETPGGPVDPSDPDPAPGPSPANGGGAAPSGTATVQADRSSGAITAIGSVSGGEVTIGASRLQS